MPGDSQSGREQDNVEQIEVTVDEVVGHLDRLEESYERRERDGRDDAHQSVLKGQIIALKWVIDRD